MFTRPLTRTLLTSLLLVSASLGLVACKQEGNASSGKAASSVKAPATLDAQLSEPRVGDLWATEISHFSGSDFGDDEQAKQAAYGLLKVIEVSADQLILVTETGAWPKKQGAINDLRGDLSNISWDDSEKIVVKRSELSSLVGEGRILETRRL